MWLQSTSNPTGTGANQFFAGHTNYTFDPSGRITRVVAETQPSGVTTNVYDLSYSYNKAAGACGTSDSGDRRQLQSSTDNKSGQSTVYCYDGSGRLLSATQAGGTSPKTYSYTYDARGNRLTAAVTGSPTQTLSYNAANQITSTGYTYDGAGNLTATPTSTYTYNGAEQMTQAVTSGVTSTYTYAGAAQNQVLSETFSGKTYQIVYGRTDGNGQPAIQQYKVGSGQAYVFSDPKTGQPLMLSTSSDQDCLYVMDGIGNPRGLLTDFSSNAFDFTYDPYGAANLTPGTGTGNGYTQNPYLFKAGTQDRATGLVKFGQRWYNPTTGTWTQQDTLDAPLDPANANRYAFAGGDPINGNDPLGLDAGDDWNFCVDGVTLLIGELVDPVAATTIGAVYTYGPPVAAWAQTNVVDPIGEDFCQGVGSVVNSWGAPWEC